jgi:acetyltransferase-like isoleucine patch superfamily enzyme
MILMKNECVVEGRSWFRYGACMTTRTVGAVHGRDRPGPDPGHEVALAGHLRGTLSADALTALWARFRDGETDFDHMMRRVLLRALARSFGDGISVGAQVGFKHPETFALGNRVFIGAQSYLQGRFDGRFEIGDGVWIGPQSYFDARDLVIGESVGWGPGAKVLGSQHVALPTDVPIVETDLEIKPVRIEAWADVGTNAVILPGVTVGRGSIVGAGAVVTKDVAPFSVVAGVPAKHVRWREGHEPI